MFIELAGMLEALDANFTRKVVPQCEFADDS